MLRIANAICQFAIIFEITTSKGISFLGEYSSIVVPITFSCWFFSLGITKMLSTYKLDLKVSDYEIRQIGGSVLLLNLIVGLFVLVYIDYKSIGNNLLLLQCFVLIFFLSLNIIVFSYLLRLRKYLFQILIQFLSSAVTLVLILMCEFHDLNDILFILLTGYAIVPLLSHKLAGLTILSLLHQSLSNVFKNIRILFSSFLAESSSYTLMRSDLLTLQVCSNNMNLIGLYYFFSQIQGGLLNIPKAYEPLLIRESNDNPKKKWRLVLFCIIQAVALTFICYVFWDEWVKRFSPDFILYKGLFKYWAFVMLIIVVYFLLRSVAYSLEMYKTVTKFNLLSSIGIITLVIYVNTTDNDILYNMIFFKGVILTLLLTCFIMAERLFRGKSFSTI